MWEKTSYVSIKAANLIYLTLFDILIKFVQSRNKMVNKVVSTGEAN